MELRGASMFALFKYSLDFDITVNIFTAKSSFGTDADGGGHSDATCHSKWEVDYVSNEHSSLFRAALSNPFDTRHMWRMAV